jgi:hypothetical protein
MRSSMWLAALGCLAVVLVACAAPATPAASTSPAATVAATPTASSQDAPAKTTLQPSAAGEEAIMSSLSQEGRDAVGLAKEDLANVLKAPVDEIKLVRAEATQWSDTSLGCPEPGKFYAQVITQGNLIVLSYAGKEYEYHAGRGRAVTCPAE